MVASLNARVQEVLSKSYMLTFVTKIRTLLVASGYLTAAFVEEDWFLLCKTYVCAFVSLILHLNVHTKKTSEL